MEEPPLPTFGQMLRHLRRARGYSTRSFADVSHHSKSLIGKWETEQGVPAVDVAEDLDDLLDAGGELAAAVARSVPAAAAERIASEVARHFAGQPAVTDEIRRKAAGSDELDVLAVRGLGIVGLNDSLLRPALAARENPLCARVLLLDPDSEAAAQRAAEVGESAAAFAAGIKLTLARLEEIAASAAGLSLCVALYASLPVWRIIRIDDVMWVSTFAAGWEGHESTIYQIPQTPRGAFWAGYTRQFDDLFTRARRVI